MVCVVELTSSRSRRPPSALETDATPEQEPQIPTLHVLETVEHSGPLVSLSSLPELEAQDWVATRKELISWIANVGLGGEDEWLAEWVLVALCGKKCVHLIPSISHRVID